MGRTWTSVGSGVDIYEKTPKFLESKLTRMGECSYISTPGSGKGALDPLCHTLVMNAE